MQNQKKRCRYCKEYGVGKNMVSVPLGYFCSFDHAALHGKKKSEAKKKKVASAKHRADKESIKTKPKWVAEAETAVRAYIRVRDFGKPCISCGNLPEQKYGGTIDAGHYRSKGAAKQLRFNTFNIHGQCVKCNRHGSGNAVDYRIGLVKKIGLPRVERLEHDNSIKRYEIEYLKRMKTIFNRRTRHLKRLRGYV